MGNNNHHAETTELATRLLAFIDHLTALGKVTSYSTSNKYAEKLHVNQLTTLEILRTTPGVPQKVLVEKLGITAASVSVAVREMEDMGLIAREPGPDDARSMNLYLTKRGQKIVDELEDMRVAAMADILHVLPLDEQRQVVGIFERALPTIRENTGELPEA